MRKTLRDAAEPGADGFDRKMKDSGCGRCDEQRDDGAGNSQGDTWPEKNDGERCGSNCERLPMCGADGADEDSDALQEFAGNRRRREAKKVLDLRGGDEQGDAVGEADGDRARDIFCGPFPLWRVGSNIAGSWPRFIG